MEQISIATVWLTITYAMNTDPIAAADAWQTKIFWVSVVFAITAAVLTAMFAILLFRASNAYQQAVKNDADVRIAEARVEVEKERNKRLELEDTLAPRTLISTPISIERLERFRGTSYVLEFARTEEATITAGRIDALLKESGWNVVGVIQHSKGTSGVQIYIRGGTPPSADRNNLPSSVLSSYLEANDWSASAYGVAVPHVWEVAEQTLGAANIPNGTLRIWVGEKPTHYFSQKSSDLWLEHFRNQASEEERSKFNPKSEENAKKWFQEMAEERREELKREWGISPPKEAE